MLLTPRRMICRCPGRRWCIPATSQPIMQQQQRQRGIRSSGFSWSSLSCILACRQLASLQLHKVWLVIVIHAMTTRPLGLPRQAVQAAACGACYACCCCCGVQQSTWTLMSRAWHAQVSLHPVFICPADCCRAAGALWLRSKPWAAVRQ